MLKDSSTGCGFLDFQVYYFKFHSPATEKGSIFLTRNLKNMVSNLLLKCL